MADRQIYVSVFVSAWFSLSPHMYIIIISISFFLSFSDSSLILSISLPLSHSEFFPSFLPSLFSYCIPPLFPPPPPPPSPLSLSLPLPLSLSHTPSFPPFLPPLSLLCDTRRFLFTALPHRPISLLPLSVYIDSNSALIQRGRLMECKMTHKTQKQIQSLFLYCIA